MTQAFLRSLLTPSSTLSEQSVSQASDWKELQKSVISVFSHLTDFGWGP